MIGETISHYRITDQLGRGGMGIVYRAEDTKLDRTVALKLLPPHALTSEDDRARFYREARAAAALSHPNIAHIYEIDEAEAGGESRPFIAMEYIDGDTLSDRIVKGPLPIKEAISIATQIADGLKAAHEKDIVHRDIKSGNVMLTKSGVVKILDFGLAKTAASTKLTQMGSTLGTVAYMSPEQARGEEVDRRTDIWSLGVILYEMITGQLPFRGDYEQAIVYGILNEDPESLTSLRAGVPMAVDGILAKLLAKDTRLRYQHVDELPADLMSLDLGSSIRATRLSTTSIETVPKHLKDRSALTGVPRWLLWACALGLFGLGFGVAALTFLRTDTAEPQKQRHYAIDPERVEGLADPKSLSSAYISPDGRRIAFNADSRLYVRSLDNLRAVPVPGSEGATAGFEWSPDGEELVFAAGGYHRSIRLSNNQVTIIGQSAGGWWEFRRDGSIAYLSDNTVNGPIATGATPQSLTVAVPGLRNSGFAELPGQGGFLVVRTDSQATSYITHVTDSEFRDLVPLPAETNAQDLFLSSSGHLLFTVSGLSGQRSEIWGIAIDLNSLAVSGGPKLIESNARDPSVSGDGKLLYLEGVTADSVEIVILDRSVLETSTYVSGLVGATAPELSPDGRYLAIDVNTGPNDGDLWIMDRQLGGFFQFSFDVPDPWKPSWSPDGRAVAYQSTLNREIYVQSFESGSEGQLLVSGIENEGLPAWSADGEWILYTHFPHAGGFAQIWRVDANGQGEPEPVVAERFSAILPSTSPDGRYVAYASDRSGQVDIFVSRYPDGDRHVRVTSSGANWPKWRGERIYYIDQTSGALMSTRVSTEPEFRAEPPEIVLSPDDVNAPFQRGIVFLWDVSANEDEIVLIRDRAAAETPGVILVEGWQTALDL